MLQLYAIADFGLFGNAENWLESLARVVRAAAAEPRVAVQLRVKGVSQEERWRLLCRARAVLGPEPPCPVLLNGDAGEASRLGLAGVHWTADGIPRESPILPPSLVVGASVHSLAELERAQASGAMFAIFGPVFDPGTKPVRGVGLDPLRSAVTCAQIPILAVGGIVPERVPGCLAAGARGVAVASGIMLATDPVAAIQSYLGAIDSASLPEATLAGAANAKFD